VTTVS